MLAEVAPITVKGRTMEQDAPIEHVVEYLVACIAMLAEGFGISMRSAYEYLDQFGGLAYLRDGYAVEHLFSLEDAVDHALEVCARNGGPEHEALPRIYAED